MYDETLRLIRNILLRSFVVGLVITLILATLTAILWPYVTDIAFRDFDINAVTLAPLVARSFLHIRFLLLYVFLTPGLAIHWTLCSRKY